MKLYCARIGLLIGSMMMALAGNLIADLSYPLTTLPGPVGQFATALVANVQQGLDNLLANLPMPVPPALASTAAAKTAVVTGPAPTAAVTGVAAGDMKLETITAIINSLKFDGDGYYLKSPAEMRQRQPGLPAVPELHRRTGRSRRARSNRGHRDPPGRCPAGRTGLRGRPARPHRIGP